MSIEFEGKKSVITPEGVFIIGTYDENGVPNAMNAAWGSIGDTKEVFLCLSPEHKSVKNILKTKEFTVSPATLENIVPADYVGIASANTVSDKMEKSPNVSQLIIRFNKIFHQVYSTIVFFYIHFSSTIYKYRDIIKYQI